MAEQETVPDAVKSEASSSTAKPDEAVKQKSEAVTPEQFNELKSGFDRFVSGFNAYMAKQRTEAKPETKAEAKPPADPALTKQVAEIEARLKAADERDKRAEFLEAARGHGVKGELLNDFVRITMLDHAERIKVEDGQVLYQENETTKTPVSDWVKAYLKTSQGQRWVAAKQAPISEALKPGNSDQPAASEFEGLTYKQVMANPALVARAVKVPGLMEKLRATQSK